LAAALIADPDLLFLDEPTSALDPVGRKEVREIIIGLRDKGKTVFLNSHLLSEVETVCDEVAIISGGYAIAQGKLKDLVGDSAEVELVCGSFPPEVVERLERLAERVEIRGDHAFLKLRDINDTPEVARAVVEAGERIYRLTPKTVSLEDLFVSLVQGGDR
jgi:ABC-2 type transport system ATP-binding protein